MDNLFLIGMSGAGKSTLGVLLAKALGMDFLDTDILLQQRTGRLLQDLLDEEGMEAFLQAEEDILASLQVHRCVVATGGSAVYSRRGMEHLRQCGRIVYLRVSYEEIARRITDITTRGVVLRKGCGLKDAYEERLPLYERYSDLTVDCTGRQIEETLRLILAQLAELSS